MEFYIHSLANGIRLIHQPISSPVAHCGIIINTGSRDENDEQHGLAHFIEHLIFKGTKRRKAHHILGRMEDVGGELNAFTTKEETCLLTSFYNNYYDRAFEIMSDIMFNSSFPVNEIQKEKEVIIDEINSYRDSPVEQLYDDFEELVFNPNPIARNILGTEAGLREYTREHLSGFFSQHYATTEMIISSVSSLSFKRVAGYFEKYFADLSAKSRTIPRIGYKPESYTPRQVDISRNTYQSHCIIGNQAYSNREDKRLVLHLLNTLLCGSGMNSRLNVALREKRGLAYNVESNYSTYSDTGIINIYFGTDRSDVNHSFSIIGRELKKLRETLLGSIQMARSKKQLIGQIAIASENFENLMISNGRSLLLYDRVDTLREMTDKINAVTAAEILEVANEIFSQGQLSRLTFN